MKRTTIVRKAAERSGRRTAPELQTIRFEYTDPTAKSVCIAGSFNDWHPAVTDMFPVGNGVWEKEIVLPPGRYEYRLVVDGRWTDDPRALGKSPNPFGGANCVLNVPVIRSSGEIPETAEARN